MFRFWSPRNRSFSITVSSLDAKLEFDLEWGAKGRDLLELVCCVLGVRQSWYFAIQYTDSNGFVKWLSMDKKVCNQAKYRQNTHFVFLAKFFPEDIEDLLEEISRHLFFLQIKRSILRMDVFCPAETSVLLASYAAQAMFGDYDDTTYRSEMLAPEYVLPKLVTDQFEMSSQMWEDKIKVWYAEHRGLTQDEAKIEYLKIARGLSMYGVNYFPLCVDRETKIFLGVGPLGVSIYDKEDKQNPKLKILWQQIQYISFNGEKLIVKLHFESQRKYVFHALAVQINKLILDLCSGYHKLFLKNRGPLTLESQQMKVHAKEMEIYRVTERNKIMFEEELRVVGELQRSALEECLTKQNEEIRQVYEALKRSEEVADLLVKRLKIADEEIIVLKQTALVYQQEVSKIESEKFRQRSVNVLESSRKVLYQDLDRTKCNHFAVTRENITTVNHEFPLAPSLQSGNVILKEHNSIWSEDVDAEVTSEPVSPGDIYSGNDMATFSLEIEKEKVKYLVKSMQLKDQLQQLRSDIQNLKATEVRDEFPNDQEKKPNSPIMNIWNVKSQSA